MRRIQIVLAGVAVVVGVAGCSSAPGTSAADSNATAVENVFQSHNRALLSRDFATACSLDTPETNTALIQRVAATGGAAATSCEDAFKKIYASPSAAAVADGIARSAQVKDVQVQGDTATITWTVSAPGRPPSTTTSSMRRINGQWRLVGSQ